MRRVYGSPASDVVFAIAVILVLAIFIWLAWTSVIG